MMLFIFLSLFFHISPTLTASDINQTESISTKVDAEYEAFLEKIPTMAIPTMFDEEERKQIQINVENEGDKRGISLFLPEELAKKRFKKSDAEYQASLQQLATMGLKEDDIEFIIENDSEKKGVTIFFPERLIKKLLKKRVKWENGIVTDVANIIQLTAANFSGKIMGAFVASLIPGTHLVSGIADFFIVGLCTFTTQAPVTFAQSVIGCMLGQMLALLMFGRIIASNKQEFLTYSYPSNMEYLTPTLAQASLSGVVKHIVCGAIGFIVDKTLRIMKIN